MRTRRLARRQARWFVPDERIRWLKGPASSEDEARIVGEALALLGTGDSIADLIPLCHPLSLDVADFIAKDDSNDRCGLFVSHRFEPTDHHGRDIEAVRL